MAAPNDPRLPIHQSIDQNVPPRALIKRLIESNPMPTEHEASGNTRHRLLEAALCVFAEKGYDGAGLREVAAQAQANSALVQYHFGSKEGLYRETLRFVFEQGACKIQDLPPPPSPKDPEARSKAIAALRAHIRLFVEDALTWHTDGGPFGRPELRRAAIALWSRELQEPRPSTEAFLQEAIRPYLEHLMGCLRILRPDLDDEALLRMDMSIHAQVHYLHNHPQLIRRIRGRAFGPEDADDLVEHFTTFSLRGLGVLEPGV